MNSTETPSNTWRRAWTGPLTSSLDRVSHPGLPSQIPAGKSPDTLVRTVCGFCSTGCELVAHLREGQAVNLSPSPDAIVNAGTACPKGWEALAPLTTSERLLCPMIRGTSSDSFVACGWDEALRVFCNKFKRLLNDHGPESVAFLSTGQITTEEMALLGALFKFGMGGMHGDSNTRQCMATSHVAYKQSFGFDAPPFSYTDFEESDTLVLIGSNLCVAHPILWQRVLKNRRSPEIVVIDPRRTETAMNATLHLPIKPKSDLVLLYGTARELVRRDGLDLEFIGRHTSGFEAFKTFVAPFTLERVAAETGLNSIQLESFWNSLRPGRRCSFWWTMGVNQSHESTRTAQAIINLALMTGNLGKPGTGANSITGQCNAMGSRLFANATSLLGGRDFADSAHRREVASLLNIPPERIPTSASLAYDQILDRIDEGRIKALWIIGTNPSHSWIDQSRLRSTLARLEFLAVQDLYRDTDTARQAHLLLPAAGWGEKEGTQINSERRIGITRKLRRAPGQALADFHIFKLVAEYWGCSERFKEWSSPEQTFQILKRLSRGRPCDFSGIASYDHLDAAGGIQWPYPDPEKVPGSSTPREPERRLFQDGVFFTPDGKARFLFEPPREPAEPPCSEYPWVLLTGRGSSAQWHTLTRTGRSPLLRELSPRECYVEISPADARALNITPGARVQVASRRGSVEVKAQVMATVSPGTLFMPMHFPETNRLTLQTVDPHSRQPSYKHCAVRLSATAQRL
ncbi:MAG: molybdopterin oxidoreductase family protein [Verrucomicrobia bacterium]|nr:molybdopterin oxidoreductase family protein [Verrucomicrobiota bacterium]